MLEGRARAFAPLSESLSDFPSDLADHAPLIQEDSLRLLAQAITSYLQNTHYLQNEAVIASA
jgi:hypothetical protein